MLQTLKRGLERKMAITELASSGPPREKLLSKAPAMRFRAELVAIFLGTGVSGKIRG
jgi:DNA repair protein RadC